jgi:hypothetical protein
MIGTVFASPRAEINEMEIHIGCRWRVRFLLPAAYAKRIHDGGDARVMPALRGFICGDVVAAAMNLRAPQHHET